jgi:hypothetical protein
MTTFAIPASQTVIPETLLKRIQTLFTEEGFTNIELEQTDRTLMLSASKGFLAAFIHVSVGRLAKGQAATSAALAHPVGVLTEPIIVPMLPIEPRS